MASRRSFSAPPVGRVATKTSSPDSIARAELRGRLGRPASVPGDGLRGQTDRMGTLSFRVLRVDAEAVEAEPDTREALADRVLPVHAALRAETRRDPDPDPAATRSANAATSSFTADGSMRTIRRRGAAWLEPARRHRRHRRREDGALRFRRRAADPLREQPPRLLGFLGGRERGEGDFLDPLLGALRVGVEEAERLDAIAIQLHADGEVAVRRKDVEEPAAHGEIAGLDDEVPAPVAQARQPLGETRERDLVAAPDPDEELARSARDREAG